jgi:hypothetical protein
MSIPPVTLEVSNTAQLRDLAQSAARVFGWDSGRDKGQSGDTHNTLIVTAEQLQQMRELCETPEERERNRNTEHQPPPAPYGPVDGELRITSDGDN